jgi:hypothetical protein
VSAIEKYRAGREKMKALAIEHDLIFNERRLDPIQHGAFASCAYATVTGSISDRLRLLGLSAILVALAVEVDALLTINGTPAGASSVDLALSGPLEAIEDVASEVSVVDDEGSSR